jgi:hypothetical protein
MNSAPEYSFFLRKRVDLYKHCVLTERSKKNKEITKNSFFLPTPTSPATLTRRRRATAAVRRTLDRRNQALCRWEDSIHRPWRGNAEIHRLRRASSVHHLQAQDPRRIRSGKQKLGGLRAPRGQEHDAVAPRNSAARGEVPQPRTPHRQPSRHLPAADRRQRPS